MSRGIVIFLVFILLVPALFAQNVSVYQTTSDMSQRLAKQSDLQFKSSGTASQTVTVDDTKTYQQVDGFGASFTDSSAWLVYTKLSSAKRDEVMGQLFDRTNGIGLSFIRQPMGASDLALNFYSYDDMPAGQSDPTLANFSIAHDKDYIVPVLKQALALNPDIKMMANPWSPPGWMKTNDSMIGNLNGNVGSLKSSAYGPLAQYFVKYIKAYEAEGIKTDYISMQNEPLYAPDGYPGMMMQPAEQANFLGNHLGPALAAEGINAKVMVWDHNWDNTSYPTTVLNDAKARGYAAGVAWHHYAGQPSAMSAVHDLYPDKDVWETEASGGTWQSGNAFAEEAQELIYSMRNWAKSYVLWNMVLDQNHGPVGKTPDGKHGCDTCRGLVTVKWDVAPATVNYELDYYVLGQASKFLQAGAHRIDSDQQVMNGLYDVAFRNPDGSIVLYVLNSKSTDQTFNVSFGGKFFTATVKGAAVATYVWATTVPPTVSLSSNPSGLNLDLGQSGTVQLTVTPTGTPKATIGCQVLDAQDNVTADYSCSAGQTNFDFTDSNPQSTPVTVTPATPSGKSPVVKPHSTGPLAALSLFGLMPLLGMVFAERGKKSGMVLGIILVAVFALMLTACGGGGGGSTPQPPPSTPTAAMPVFSVTAGTYNSVQTVTITDATAGATIYYTTDNSTPTTSSTKYTTPLTVSTTQTIKAIAMASGYNNSAIASATYTLKAADPTFSPAAGPYVSAQQVTISTASSGAEIHYTTDGSTPSANSTKYTAPIAVSSSLSVKAIAIATGYTDSSVATAAYKIGEQTTPPVFSLASGTYEGTQTVTITDATAGASIYYTTDGTMPTTASTKYTGPVTIAATKKVQAFATATGYIDSGVSSADYTIVPPPLSYTVVITATTDTGTPVVLRIPMKVKQY